MGGSLDGRWLGGRGKSLWQNLYESYKRRGVIRVVGVIGS